MKIIKTQYGNKKVNLSYEIPYLAGYSKDGKTIYIDKRLNLKLKLKDGRIMDITKYLVIHEIIEKHLEDTKKYKYRYAHEKATGIERKAVEADGYPWTEYQTYMLHEVKKLEKIDKAEPLPINYDDKPEHDSKDYYMLTKIRAQQIYDLPVQIIPGILAKNKQELKKQLNDVKWAERIHIDIIDGKFAPNKTIQKIPKLKQKFGVHLMVAEPMKYINNITKAQKIIIPAKTVNLTIIKKIQDKGIEAGIAFEPETNVKQYKKELKQADIAQIMTVHSGYYGQKFIKEAISKIKEIRKINPIIKVGIDGGINKKTIKYVKEADYAIATSAVTLALKPKKAYKELIQ